VTAFHFAEPVWLWLLLLAPFWLLWRVVGGRSRQRQLQRFADPHLLPHLLVQRSRADHRWLPLWPWLWALMVLALAGPRWDFGEVETFPLANAAVILLDLSRSMDAVDVTPSRLARARQEITDLVAANPAVRLGLVAFAAVPHVVAPVTEDMGTLLNLLPAMESALAVKQGTQLVTALQRCKQLLALESGSSKSVILLSDGEFSGVDPEQLVEELKTVGVRLYILGMGTSEGAPVPTPGGEWYRDADGVPVLSRLNEKGLQRLAAATGGFYQRADYRQGDTAALLQALVTGARGGEAGERSIRLWNERYYIFLIPLMLLLLARFRRELPVQEGGG